MSNISRKEIRRIILKFTVPATIEYALQTIGAYLNYIMVSHLGIRAAAVAGLNVEVNFLVRGLNMAIGIGIMVYIANAAGSGDHEKVRNGSKQGLKLAVIFGLAETIIMLILSPVLPVILGAEKSLQGESTIYFLLIYSSVLFTSVNVISGFMLRAVGNMKVPMYVNIVVNSVNILLNILLIYDGTLFALAGMSIYVPGAGLKVYGAAVAASLAAVLGGICMMVCLGRNKALECRITDLWLDIKVIKEFLTVGMPVMISRTMTSIGRLTFTSMVTGLGTIAFASHSIAFTAESMFYIPVIGFQTAVTAMAGMALGEKDRKKLNMIAGETVRMAASIMFVMGIILFAFSEQIIHVFSNDPDIISIGGRLLKIVALNEPLFAASVVLEGIFNGIGKTKIPLKISITSLWLIRVAGTLICLNIFRAGIYAAWICMISDNIFRCFLLTLKYRKTKEHLISTGAN